MYCSFIHLPRDSSSGSVPAEALKRAKRLAELYFEENWESGRDIGYIKAQYIMYGQDPVIFSDNGENVPFSAWNYAEQFATSKALKFLLNSNQPQDIYQLIIKYVAEKHINQKVPGTELPYLVENPR
jgi:hypothetical protein